MHVRRNERFSSLQLTVLLLSTSRSPEKNRVFLLCRRMRNMSKSGPESLRVAAKQLLETWKQKVAALPAAGNKRCDRHLLYQSSEGGQRASPIPAGWPWKSPAGIGLISRHCQSVGC